MLWRTRLPGQGPVGAVAIGPHGEAYAGTGDGWLAAVAGDGAIRWQFQAGALITRSPVVAADGTVYVMIAKALLAGSPEGRLGWCLPIGGTVVGGPLLADDGTVFMTLLDRSDQHGAALAVSPAGRASARLALPGPPAPSLSLARHRLWVGLRDETVRRLSIPQQGLAPATWAKARGDLGNTGAGIYGRCRFRHRMLCKYLGFL